MVLLSLSLWADVASFLEEMIALSMKELWALFQRLLCRWPRGRPKPGGAGPVVPAREMSGRGFTLIEILLVTLIIGILASMSAPMFGRALERARIAKAIGDVDAIGMDLIAFELTEGRFPASLEEIDRDHLLDPWGNPYEYLPIRGSSGGKGKFRKDRFLVPINSDFDLYSMGPDGKSASPLTASMSRDDIIRANDGGYVGVAEFY